jgi:septum formation inhibitor-activating ATPase MinD
MPYFVTVSTPSLSGHWQRRAFDHIGLARTRLIQREYEGAAASADTAITLLGDLSSSRVADRLRELLTETEHHADNRAVSELRERLTNAIG